MIAMELGNSLGALLFLGLMITIGLALGIVVFVVVAFPWTRRPRFRNFDAMPRTGVVCGLGVALFMGSIAWCTVAGDFHHIEIREGIVRLRYLGSRTLLELPVDSIAGVRRDTTMAKWDRWRIVLETEEGAFHSTPLERHRMEEVWKRLGDFVKPLP